MARRDSRSVCAGVCGGTLSARLAELKAAGLLTREVIDGPPIASMYRLTLRGEALRPVLLALGEWAHDHPASKRCHADRAPL